MWPLNATINIIEQPMPHQEGRDTIEHIHVKTVLHIQKKKANYVSNQSSLFHSKMISKLERTQAISQNQDNMHRSKGGGRGGQGVRTTLQNHKNIGILSNTGLDSLENHLLLPSQHNGPLSPHKKVKVGTVGPLLTKLS